MIRLQIILLLLAYSIPINSYAQQNKVDELVKELATAYTDSAKSLIYSNIAFSAISTDLDYSKKCVDLALELAVKSKSKFAKANAYKNLGLYYMYISKYAESYNVFDSAMYYYKSINDTDGISRVYNNIGLNYLDEGNYLKALEFMEKSLEICDSNKDTASALITMNNIGVLYYYLADYDKAKLMFDEVIRLSNIIHDNEIKIGAYINLIDLVADGDSTELSLHYINEAIKLSEQIGDSLSIYDCYASKAHYERIAGNYENALKLVNNSLRFYQQNGIPINYSNSLIIKSEIYKDLKKFNKAEKLLNQAYNIADSVNYNSYKYDAAYALEQYYAQKNDFVNAYKYLKVVNELSDTFNVQINNKELAQKEYALNLLKAQTEFDIEAEKQKLAYENQLNKERVIKNTFFIVLLFSFVLVLLGFRVANSRKKINNELMAKTAIISEKQDLLNIQNEELANLTEVQSKTLSIISHDIRGPLNSLKGILSYLEHGLVNPDEFQSYIKRINAQLERNFILFDNLLKWASSQMKGVSINYEHFNIVQVISENVATYQFIADEKNIQISASNLQDAMISADKDLISLVFRNLLSNAIKYSFQDSKISINCNVSKNKVKVCVTDQGIGIPENQISEIFKLKSNSSDGTNNEKGTGLGLYFCKYAIEKNNGKIWVESTVNKGSTFCFELDVVS